MRFKTLAEKVRCDVRWVDSNPNIDDMPAGSRHFSVTLRYKGRQMTVPFSQGPAIEQEPDAEGVLECLLSDASGAEESFEDWCGELGCYTDSRRAEKTYRAVAKQSAQTRRLLGEDFDLFWEADR